MTKHHKHHLINKVQLLLTIGAVMSIGVSLIIYFSPSHAIQKPKKTAYVPETPKNEIHKLPSDVAQKLPVATYSGMLRVPILMYHYVEVVRNPNDKMRKSLTILPSVFEKQVKTLKDAGYTFMTAEELGQVLDGKASLPTKPVILTFDDGHWDLYTDVLPILRKYQVKATAYIVPGFLNGSDSLSIDQFMKVADSGLVEIGAHTVHHVWLKDKSLPIVIKEVDDSKLMLENMLHRPVVSFAYPYGAFDQQAEDVVKKDGFRTGVSTIPGIEQSPVNRYFLYRLRPGARTGETLLSFLNQNTFQPW